MLICNGIGFRTKLLDVIVKSHPINDYVLLCIQARLRVKGKIICRRVQTLLKEGDLPHAGDLVNIRYRPRQLNHVLLNWVYILVISNIDFFFIPIIALIRLDDKNAPLGWSIFIVFK